ncbi:hypothetical protein AAC387_Pa02g2363 [Persea americana]
MSWKTVLHKKVPHKILFTHFDYCKGECYAAEEETCISSSTALAFRQGEVGEPDARGRVKFRRNKAPEIMEPQNRHCTKQIEDGIGNSVALSRPFFAATYRCTNAP